MDALILPILVFGAVVLLALTAFIVLSPHDNTIQIRLGALDGSKASGGADSPGETSGGGALKKDQGTFFGGLAKKLGDSAKKIFEGGGDETEHRLAMAGLNPQTYLATFHGARVMIGMGLATLGALYMLLTGAPVGKMVLAAGVGILSGMLLPNIWLSIQINKRKEKISASLPNMVDLLVVCV